MRTRRTSRSRTLHVDLTPLLDAVFLVVVLLLCVFVRARIVSTVEVQRPRVASGTQALTDTNVAVITVDRLGQITFDEKPVVLSSLRNTLADRAARFQSCLITADRRAEHGTVTDVLVAAKQALGDKPTYFEVQSDSR